MHVMYVQKIVTKCAEILLRNARCNKMRRNVVTNCAFLQNMQKFCNEMRALLHYAQWLQNAEISKIKFVAMGIPWR